MPSDPALADVPAEGSLGLLAFGYRGVLAWRAVRGTEWIEERRRTSSAASARGVPPPPDPDRPSFEGLTITIVSGLPRSGTSMLMQMLAAGGLEPFTDAEREADASNPRGYFEHARVKALARDKGWLPDADHRVVKVVSPLLPHLPAGPRYRVLLLDRDVEEVLRSQQKMLERDGRVAADAGLLRDAYRRHTQAARRWAEHRGAALLDLSHANVVAHPPAAAAQIADFLGGGLDVDAMAAAVDPTLHRERTP